MYLDALFSSLDGSIVKPGAFLKDYTTFRIGGKALAVIEPRDNRELIEAIECCRANGLQFVVIGNGSNILADSRNIKKVVITTRNISAQPVLHQTFLKVSAGQSLGELIGFAASRGLSGLEKLSGIPATIGGAVINNAGAFGVCVADCLQSVEVLCGGKVMVLDKSQLKFEYHHSNIKDFGVLLSVELKLKRLASSTIRSIIKEVALKRSQSQPSGFSAGSIFKATELGAAGKLIDDVGLKGFTHGGAKISEKHANFIINSSNAKSSDVFYLMRQARKRVKKTYGIDLEAEVEYLGDYDDSYWRLSHP